MLSYGEGLREFEAIQQSRKIAIDLVCSSLKISCDSSGESQPNSENQKLINGCIKKLSLVL